MSIEGDRASAPVYGSVVDWGLPGFGDIQITKNLQQLLAAGRAPFSLDTSKPVDLASTWIASASGVESLFLNSQTESASEGGLDVAAECLHTGGGQPAKLLRRKIQGLLPAMDGEQLILDFSGVKSAASSFLDELLGRLAAEDPRG